MAESIQLPELYFKALCQNKDCRTLLGGFHVPCREGMLVYACGKCGQTSVFRIEPYQIRAAVAGPLAEPPAPGVRRR